MHSIGSLRAGSGTAAAPARRTGRGPRLHTVGNPRKSVTLTVLTGLFTLYCLLPLVWLVINSTKTQADFVSNLTDSLKSGIGTLVDADMEEASARLQALQVQQQLATQSLSIANQAPQSLLSLFRG